MFWVCTRTVHFRGGLSVLDLHNYGSARGRYCYPFTGHPSSAVFTTMIHLSCTINGVPYLLARIFVCERT